jgi:hypothetical protein
MLFVGHRFKGSQKSKTMPLINSFCDSSIGTTLFTGLEFKRDLKVGLVINPRIALGWLQRATAGYSEMLIPCYNKGTTRRT